MRPLMARCNRTRSTALDIRNTSLGATRQQDKQTESGEDNLQQKERGSGNPVNVADSESPEGIWLNQVELIQAQDKIGSLTSNAAAAVELLSQVKNENEGLRLHVALLEKRAKDPDTRSMIGADLHHGGQPEPGDVLYGQNRGNSQKELAAAITPQERSEMNTEAMTRRLEELEKENQVKYSGSTWRADAQHPREAPPDISTPPSRHLENYPQKLSAGTIDLVEHLQAGNR